VKPESPSIEQDKMVSPHAPEVEDALILSRMINIVKEEPSERKQLSVALETAIQGVERFSVRTEEKERLKLSTPPAQTGLGPRQPKQLLRRR
jgi:hypothetical protein